MKSRRKNLDKFLKAVEIHFSDWTSTEVQRLWPANGAQLDSYFGVDSALTIFQKWKENPQLCRKALLKLTAFNLIASLYHNEIIGLKVARARKLYPLSAKEILNFVLFFIGVLQEKMKGELFALDGTHKILPVAEARRLNQDIPWVRVNSSQTQRTISKLIVSLESYVWSLFFDVFPDAGVEKHGPYRIRDGILVLREYEHLDPQELWRFRSRYSKVHLFLKYSKDAHIAFSFGNQIASKQSVRDKLIAFAINVDGRFVTTPFHINTLVDYFVALTEKQAKNVQRLSPIEIITKGAEIYYFRLKEFFQYYHQDWRPPEAVYAFIKKTGLKFWNRFKTYGPKKRPGSYWRKLFDPRNLYLGE